MTKRIKVYIDAISYPQIEIFPQIGMILEAIRSSEGNWVSSFIGTKLQIINLDESFITTKIIHNTDPDYRVGDVFQYRYEFLTGTRLITDAQASI